MHNIEHYTYDEKVNRNSVQKELDAHAAYEDRGEGCTGLGQKIRWLENAGICKDEEEAVKTIKQNDRGWYDQLAVRFYEPVRGFTDKKFEGLKAREIAALDAYNSKRFAVWAKGLKAAYVSCRNCGSMLKRELIKSNICPLCRADLRPDSTIQAEKAAEMRFKKAEAARNTYEYDHAKKAVKWLVKIEYHT